MATVKPKASFPLRAQQDVHFWMTACLQWQRWKKLEKDDFFLHQRWSQSELNRTLRAKTKGRGLTGPKVRESQQKHLGVFTVGRQEQKSIADSIKKKCFVMYR